MSISIVVKSKEGKEVKEIKFVSPCKILDHVMEITLVNLNKGDILQVRWNIKAEIYHNDVSADKKDLKFEASFVAKNSVSFKFVRLVRYKDKAKIFVYKELPKVLLGYYDYLIGQKQAGIEEIKANRFKEK